MSETPNTQTPSNENPETKGSYLQNNVHHTHVGPILAVLLIMLVIILGGLFLWGSILTKIEPEPILTPVINNEPETPRADADTSILLTVSPSDELSAIEADLTSTNFDSFDTDMTAIDGEFNASN